MIKAYTDLEQSKRLAEFLPLDSADCYWSYDSLQGFHRIEWFEDGYNKQSQLREKDIPCWSLAALMELLPETVTVIDKENEEDYTDYILCIIKEDGQWTIYYEEEAHSALDIEWLIDDTSKYLLDAAYNVIVELHSRELL